MTSTDQVLGRSRPLASEVTARSHAHLVAREVETRARGPEAGHAGLGVSFGFLLMIVDLPGYPHVHGVPFSSFLCLMLRYRCGLAWARLTGGWKLVRG